MPVYVNDRPLEPVKLASDTVETSGLRVLQLVPDGEVVSEHGIFNVDAEGAALVIDHFHRLGTSLLIDFEHASIGGEYARADGLSPAAGWVEDLFYEPGRGIMGRVQWNDHAKDLIRKNEYRYLSPVTLIRKDDRRLVAIDSIGLTNKPAIHDVERTAASWKSPDTETTVMATENGNETKTTDSPVGAPLQALFAELVVLMRKMGGVQLPENPAMTDVLREFIKKMQAALKDGDGDKDNGDTEVAANVRRVLELPSDANADAVTLALTTRAVDDQARRELAELQARDQERIVDEAVAKYVNTGVLLPTDETQMTAARRLAREDPDQFEVLMSRARPILPPGRTTPPPRAAVERDRTVRNAMTEYQANDRLRHATSMVTHVNLALHDAGFEKLDDDEAKRFSIQTGVRQHHRDRGGLVARRE